MKSEGRTRPAARAILGTLLFTIIIPAGVTIYLPALIAGRYPSILHVEIGAWRWLAILPAALGLAIYLWCAADFIRAQGTPMPIDPPKEMVARALYRYVRNPMYVAVLLVILGAAIFFGSGLLVIYGLAIFTAVHLFVILYEEPHLRRTFGAAYERYCQDVPRWLPRLKRRI